MRGLNSDGFGWAVCLFVFVGGWWVIRIGVGGMGWMDGRECLLEGKGERGEILR